MSFIPQPITLQSVFGKKRMIGPITVQLIVSEDTTDTLTITKQPVQTGASITDHAYLEPAVLSMRIRQQDTSIAAITSTFTGNGLAAIYQTFRDLQSSRTPFNVLTPKRIYNNMLIASLHQTTDKSSEYILALDVTFQEVILVSVGVTTISPLNQGNKAKTQATQNAGRKSALATLSQAVGWAR